MFGSKKRKTPTTAEAIAPVADDEIPLCPKWLAEQELAADEAERMRELAIDDGSFATAVWLAAADEAFREPNGGGAGRRVARIISLGAASGLTGGQIEALERLAERINAVRDVLDRAERGRARARPQSSYAARF